MYFLFLFCYSFFSKSFGGYFFIQPLLSQKAKKNIRSFMSQIFCAPKMVALEEVNIKQSLDIKTE